MQLEAGVKPKRGDALVCIVAVDQRDKVVRCLRSVAEHTSPEIPIAVFGEKLPTGLLGELDQPRELALLGGDFTSLVAVTAPADLVLLSADMLAASGWLGRLRASAYLDSTVATATALLEGSTGGLAGAQPPARPGGAPPQARDLAADAAAAIAGSARIRPRIPKAGSRCVYVRRGALELVGTCETLDEFSSRCVERGLSHVLADDLLSCAPDRVDLHQQLGEISERRTDPVERSLGAVRRSLHGLSLTLDARPLAGLVDGARIQVLELIGAVAKIGDHRLRVLVGDDLDSATRDLLETVQGAELVIAPSSAEEARSLRADVVHRVSPIDDESELELLEELGERVIVTQPSLITYNTPVYFPSTEAWERHRELTRNVLAAVDRVVFLSSRTREQAVSEGLVEPQRTSVVQAGVDRSLTGVPKGGGIPPAGLEEALGDRQMILCVGTDLWHENRPFALRVLAELSRRYKWPGALVLAGRRVTSGSSQPEEERLLQETPDLRDTVIDVGEVDDEQKQWLLGRARLVLYPALREGFGLLPFEAAERDVPCLWASGTSMSDLLPERAAGIVPWDAEATAQNAIRLLRDDIPRSENVGAIKGIATAQRWTTAATLLADVYKVACEQPPTPLAGLPGPPAPEPAEEPHLAEEAEDATASEALAPEAEAEPSLPQAHRASEADAPAVEAHRASEAGEASAVAAAPGPPELALPPDVAQALGELVNHPRLGRPALAVIRSMYRLVERWRAAR